MKSTRPSKAPRTVNHPRSICPIACSLDIIGDKWTMLVVRELMLGKTSFKDFATGPEGIPTNILTDRLGRLQEAGMIEQKPVANDGRRLAYYLTTKGKALKPVLMALVDWGLEWIEGTATKRT
jgi:DNA-binding HxlR family transcriptional regulator